MDFFEERRAEILKWKNPMRRPPSVLEGRRVLVVGLERSGLWVARFAHDNGAIVRGTDIRRQEELKYLTKLPVPKIELKCGGHERPDFEWAEIVVVSPGVSSSLPLLRLAEDRGADVVSEVEFAFWFIDFPLIAVTATNGKSTVTEFTHQILSFSNLRVFKGGNIGIPLIKAMEGDYELGIVEISSFQMELVRSFRPHIGTVLNIAPDHLDRHSDFEEYRMLKARIFEAQEEDDFAILNREDPGSMSLSGISRGSELLYGIEKEVEKGAYFRSGEIRFKLDGAEGNIRTSLFPFPSVQNIENLLPSCLIALLCGVTPERIERSLPKLKALPHRLEFCGEVKGVRFFNDSKGTNVHAVEMALRNFEKGVILIAGGKDKGIDFTPLGRTMAGRVKTVVLIGEAADRMEMELRGVSPIVREEDLRSAVLKAFSIAQAGDTILLSPACSSFDMFENYEERGEVFRNAVQEIIDRYGE